MTPRDVELTPSPAPPRRRWGLFGVYLAVLAVVLAGGWALAVRGDPTAEPPDTTVTPSTTQPQSPEQVFELVPASPIDGKQSQRLPVLATVQSDLVDGQLVGVLGKGFLPGERVGAVMCAMDAALEGVTACDLGSNGGFDRVTYADASDQGFVRVDVPVRTQIETPLLGPVDCLSAAERCIIAIGAVSDYDRSGGTAIGFAGQPAFPEPSLSVSGGQPVVPGDVVEVVGSGLLWPREVELQLCAADACTTLARGRVGTDGTFGVAVALPRSFALADGTAVSCDAGCEVRLGYLAIARTTQAPVPEPYAVTFLAAPEQSAPPVPVEPVIVTDPTDPTVPTTELAGTVIEGSPYPVPSTLPPISQPEG